MRGSDVSGRFGAHVGGHIEDGEVLGDGDAVRHGELPDHGPGSHRLGEGPLQGGCGVAAALPLSAAVAQAVLAASLAGDGA